MSFGAQIISNMCHYNTYFGSNHWSYRTCVLRENQESSLHNPFETTLENGNQQHLLLDPQIFARENYQIWSIKMQTYLEAFDLWEVVAEDEPIAPLPVNPTLAQIKAHTDEKTKKFKAKTLIQNLVADSVCHRIMNYKRAKEA